MFEFYEFNNLNIFIVLVSTFIIYNLLCKKNKENKLNIKNLILASFISLLLSCVVSYVLALKDEQLLTDNYWDTTENMSL